MGFLVGSALLAILMSFGAAKFTLGRWPEWSASRHMLVAASAFPLLALVAFAVMVVVTLAGPQPQEPGGTTGMVVFAMVFFLVYALGVALIVGLPSAWVAVRVLR
ncbi:hypothetical protein [Sphingobium lactosutens]|uniref:Uncharacterized protein n=1 Tax=Sphingobium lactosutens DS20 TaxID=1331060 RepID=T0IMS4_9SPHN|nr:hypothetical protein [Sphingobium lactosutens]EQB10929.1 hypothetical protein RLDS_26195 [Sphingobium lactosutens DS20]